MAQTQKDDMAMQFQQLKQQLQMVMMQKEQYKLQVAEIEKAEDELKDAKGDVFKAAGMILIKSEKDDIKKDLASQKETIEVRMKTFDKQETILKTRISEIQSKLMDSLKDNSAAK